jgi:hypothetical protein
MDIKKLLLKSKIESLVRAINDSYIKKDFFAWLDKEAFRHEIAKRHFFFEYDGSPYDAILQYFKAVETIRQLQILWNAEQLGETDTDWGLIFPMEAWLHRLLRDIEKRKFFGTPYEKSVLEKTFHLVVQNETRIAILRRAIKNPIIHWDKL